MTQIATVLGHIDTADLGFTLMHEHIFILSPGVYSNWPHLWNHDAEIENAISTMEKMKAAGIDSIVDLTTVDLGRDPILINEVAQNSPVNIVMCTGVWRQPPNVFQSLDSDSIADLFVKDIEDGIANSQIHAGIIKLATEPTVDEENEKMLRAGARAHRRTGVPISTHTDVSTQSGLAQQNIFEDEGVDLSRVVIGHSGDTTDIDYLTRLMERGSTIGMDRFGIDRALTTEERIDTIVKLCELGFSKQIVLSHDTNCQMDARKREDRQEIMPNWHYSHISQDVLPELRARGISEEQINQMTIANPKRIFDQQGSY